MLAIVPFRGGDQAKQRLAADLPAEERCALAQDMLEIVLDSCRQARSIDRIIVVTPNPDFVPKYVETVVDAGEGHAVAIETALARLGISSDVFIVMGDCPRATHAAIDAVIEAAWPVAYVPARDGGVNAFAWRGPRRWPLPFGGASAQARTREALREAGIEAAVLADSPLAFDVDRPDEAAGAAAR